VHSKQQKALDDSLVGCPPTNLQLPSAIHGAVGAIGTMGWAILETIVEQRVEVELPSNLEKGASPFPNSRTTVAGRRL
jgi:hypothetical protein